MWIYYNTNQFVPLCASGPVVLEINESYVKTQDDGGFNLGVKHVQGKLSYQDMYSLYICECSILTITKYNIFVQYHCRIYPGTRGSHISCAYYRK